MPGPSPGYERWVKRIGLASLVLVLFCSLFRGKKEKKIGRKKKKKGRGGNNKRREKGLVVYQRDGVVRVVGTGGTRRWDGMGEFQSKEWPRFSQTGLGKGLVLF